MKCAWTTNVCSNGRCVAGHCESRNRGTLEQKRVCQEVFAQLWWRLFFPPLCFQGVKKKMKGQKYQSGRGTHSLPICPVHDQSPNILPFKFKIFVSLEVLSERVGKHFTIDFQVRSSMFFCGGFFFFFFFSILVVANYITACMRFSATCIIVL